MLRDALQEDASSADASPGSTCAHHGEEVRLRQPWQAIVVGQVLSVLLAGTGVFSQLLARGWVDGAKGFSAPALQNLIAYLLLTVLYGTCWVKRRSGERGEHHPIGDELERSEDQEVVADGFARLGTFRVPVYYYAMISFCDVTGNFLAVLAYRYTNVTSITLLDCFAIPVVMVLSRFFLQTRYGRKNIVGVVTCLVGLVLVVLSDIVMKRGGSADAPQPVIGDVLAISAAFFYGTSNVAQEAMVKTYDRVEFLFMLGFWGMVYSSILVVATELDTISSFSEWGDFRMYLLLTGYLTCLVGMYVGISAFLVHFDAALLNLSLLSSDVWAVFAGIWLFHEHLHPLYFLALFAIIGGVFIYNSVPPKTNDSPDKFESMLSEIDIEGDVEVGS